MLLGPLRWVLLYVADLEMMADWYQKTFDLKPKMKADTFVAFDTGGCTFELMGSHDNGPEEMNDVRGWDRNKVLISFIVENIEDVVTKVEARGCKSVSGIKPTVAPTGEQPIGYIAQFMDPEGNLVEICQEPADYV